MASSLRRKLDELASSFASDVLHAIRSASIEDLLAESTGRARPPAGRDARAPAAAAPRARAAQGGRRRGRLARRSAGDIAGFIERIVGLVRSSSKGLRAEEIRKKLGVQAKELPRPLKEAVDAGHLGRSGQKRATTYFAKSATPPKAAPAPAAAAAREAPKKAPRKAARKAAGKAAKKPAVKPSVTPSVKPAVKVAKKK